jgi:ATP-dependent RNA helicase RhlE
MTDEGIPSMHFLRHISLVLYPLSFSVPKGKGISLKPMNSAEKDFHSLGVTRQFINAMEDMGYEEPTEIQVKAIPRLLAGQDLIGIAQTGTGKTAAFVVPMLQRLKYASIDIPRAIILEPTKELVIQTESMVRKLMAYTDLRAVAIYGGAAIKSQRQALEDGVDIIVASPGRFMELYLSGHLKTKKLEVLVLDEADRLMDMGFMPQLRSFLEVIPVKRQNMLFSATFGEKVESLSSEFLEFPTRVEVSPQASTADTIEQRLYHLPNFKTKLFFIERLLNAEDMPRVLIFCRTKDRADRVFRFLERKVEGEVRVIHSNKGQNTRINAFRAFQEGEVRVLVATDVSARGIDVALVSHVVNLDIPRTIIDYTHRIGRTGRAKNQGVAISFADPSEMFYIKKIQVLIQMQIPLLKAPKDLEVMDFLPREERELAMELDRQKKLADPTFKGAFHERKSVLKRKGLL